MPEVCYPPSTKSPETYSDGALKTPFAPLLSQNLSIEEADQYIDAVIQANTLNYLDSIPTAGKVQVLQFARNLFIYYNMPVDMTTGQETHSHNKTFADNVGSRFAKLAKQWREETVFMSMTEDIVMNRAYQRIVALGPTVIPFVLSDMERTHDHWFWALEMLTGLNPVKEEHQGNIPAMVNDWLECARENDGFLS